MISIDTIKNAAEIIKRQVIRTPLVHSPSLSRLFGANIFLKMENLQKTGSFKIRGATYKLLSLGPGHEISEIVAASAGNHAQGVALAAKNAGLLSTIVMPEWSSISKQEATKGYGGKVVCFGQSIDESLVKATELAVNDKLFIHPFDDPDIIAGQGTIGLEILEDLNEVDMILIPIGGGGLISGIASAVKSVKPGIKIIGIQAAACPSARDSLKKGKPVRVVSKQSIADGISVKQVGQHTFQIIKELVDDVFLVEEEDIAEAMLMLLEQKKILAEGSGAVGLAALLNGSVRMSSKTNVVLLISGGNVDSPLLGRILRKGLMKKGRVMRFEVILEDTPGSLSRLLNLVALTKANVLHIYHDRDLRDLAIYRTLVDLEIETRSLDHLDELAGALRKAGYQLNMK
ncbi:MAG: threonine ammonia-lyase [Desulfobacterales bacterium]